MWIASSAISTCNALRIRVEIEQQRFSCPLLGGLDNTAGNFAAVCDQDLIETSICPLLVLSGTEKTPHQHEAERGEILEQYATAARGRRRWIRLLGSVTAPDWQASNVLRRHRWLHLVQGYRLWTAAAPAPRHHRHALARPVVSPQAARPADAVNGEKNVLNGHGYKPFIERALFRDVILALTHDFV